MRSHIVTAIIASTLLFPISSQAHTGEHSYFFINGVYTLPDPSPHALNESDLAPDSYTINTPVHFELDTNQFIIPGDHPEKALFTWDFGDGTQKETRANAYKNEHTYTKPGNYTLDVFIDLTQAGYETNPPILIEHTIVTVYDGIEKPAPKRPSASSFKIFSYDFWTNIRFLGIFAVIVLSILYGFTVKRK